MLAVTDRYEFRCPGGNVSPTQKEANTSPTSFNSPMSRSHSMPYINPVIQSPTSSKHKKKMKDFVNSNDKRWNLKADIHQVDSNGSIQGILKDSGYDANSQSGTSYTLRYDGEVVIDNDIGLDIIVNSGNVSAFYNDQRVQGDFPSGASNSGIMLASEPQSEAAEAAGSTSRLLSDELIGGEIKSRLNGMGKTEDNRHGSGMVEAVIVSSKNGRQLVLDPYDKKLKDLRTLKQHYYPEGGWGWVIVLVTLTVHGLSHGTQYGIAMFTLSQFPMLSPPPFVRRLFVINSEYFNHCGWLGAMSTSVSLFISPLVIGLCRRKSTRLTAVMGGLITALGCLFTSFASQFHQLFFSYGMMIGIGVAMTRDPATLMIGQYFKRKREFVEIILVSGSGLGIATMSVFIRMAISSIGWRLGLQAVTGVVFITFLLGTFYRSASLYHPQRRAILHLKSQKRKIKNKDKEKNKVQDDAPPFFDFTTLRSRTVQLLLCSIAIASVGMNTPIFYLAQQASAEGIKGKQLLLLHTYLGIAWTLGCIIFGCVVVNNSTECRISKQYLCQAALFMSGLSILAFTAVQGYNGYVVFVWIFGIFSGGYHYSLKMYIYEKVRARNFARAWGFAQFSMSLPNMFGVPITGYINSRTGGRQGYYFSAVFVIIGSLFMLFIDLHRRNLRKKKQEKALQRKLLSENVSLAADGSIVNHGGLSLGPGGELSAVESPIHESDHAKASFAEHDEILNPPYAMPPMLSHHSIVYDDDDDDLDIDLKKPELTLYSEEGIADMDLPDNILLEDLDYLDNITSCNKVENCLMLSEYEQNLIKETEGPNTSGVGGHNGHRRGRKWSLFRQPTLQTIHSEDEDQLSMTIGVGGFGARSAAKNDKKNNDGIGINNPSLYRLGHTTKTNSDNEREVPSFSNFSRRFPSSGPKRSITVIDEASV